jgi:hypothetical protein
MGEPLKAEPLKAEPLKAEPLKAEPLKDGLVDAVDEVSPEVAR